ncbi:MAG: glycerophosphodiester phosphodiesterase [Planctomycetaceae bacterium]
MTARISLSLLATMLAIVTTTGAAAPLVIAHRGASGYLPEHTLPAKAMAHAQAADFIEQDVVLTRDDVPVVLHDVFLDAVSDVAERYPGRARADGRHYAIDFTLEELRSLRLFERCDPKTGRPTYPGRFPPRTGSFRIATLEEELDLLDGLAHSTGRRAGIYPEIKQPAWHRREGHDPTAIIAEVLRRRGLDAREAACLVQCFEAEELERLRTALGWQGRLILLVGEAPDAGPDPLLDPGALAKVAKVVDGIGPPLTRVVTPEGRPTGLVAAAHAAGLAVHAYTFRVDRLPAFAQSPADALQLLVDNAGVDGLFSDFPDVCVAWRASRAASRPPAR